MFRLQHPNQFLGMFLFFEAILLIKVRRLEISASFYCSPFSIKVFSFQCNTGKDTVKRGLHKRSDLPFAAHDHSKHTGHDPAYGDCLIFTVQVIRNTVAITQSQDSGKIDSHQIIFLCPQIGRIRQIVISRQFFCLTDSSKDFFFCLRIDPYSTLIFIFHTRHLCHQTIDIFSLTPGVGTHINRLYIRTVQKPLNNVKLFLHPRNHFILKFTR